MKYIKWKPCGANLNLYSQPLPTYSSQYLVHIDSNKQQHPTVAPVFSRISILDGLLQNPRIPELTQYFHPRIDGIPKIYETGSTRYFLENVVGLNTFE